MFLCCLGVPKEMCVKLYFRLFYFAMQQRRLVWSASAIEKCRLRCWVGFSNHCSCGQAVWNIELARTYTRCVCGRRVYERTRDSCVLFLSLGDAGHLDMYFVYFYVNHFLFVKLNTYTYICIYCVCVRYMHICMYMFMVCVIWYIFNDDFIYSFPFDLQV